MRTTLHKCHVTVLLLKVCAFSRVPSCCRRACRSPALFRDTGRVSDFLSGVTGPDPSWLLVGREEIWIYKPTQAEYEKGVSEVMEKRAADELDAVLNGNNMHLIKQRQMSYPCRRAPGPRH